MRAIITASGIQDYIFDISQKAASARLRGRSARLELVLALCHQTISEKIKPENFRVLRSAGSRLDIEFEPGVQDLGDVIDELQAALDRHSRNDLDGQVWFSAALGESNEIDHKLAERNLNPGRRSLQQENRWNEDAFMIRRQTDERKLQREDRELARSLPEAALGRQLAHHENRFFQFTRSPNTAPIRILDRFVTVTENDPHDGYRFALEQDSARQDQRLIRKRLCRYAPAGKDGNLLDLNEIAELSRGAHFLGVLKMDLDNASEAFSQCKTDDERRVLSDHLDRFFTIGVEKLLEDRYPGCYVVYSGGDDLFLLGPWDQTIRFALALQDNLRRSAASWGHDKLSISAGVKLSHPGSAVRHLASEADAALYLAKRKGGKNCVTVFERLLKWDEVEAGVAWANQFIAAAGQREVADESSDPEDRRLSAGFVQRMQYYASQALEFFERQQLDGLCAIPLFHNDWTRNRKSMSKELQAKLEKDIVPWLTSLLDDSGKKWRVMEFASRYANYALREPKGGEQ
jgi:CRISPR-associated protein Csm1